MAARAWPRGLDALGSLLAPWPALALGTALMALADEPAFGGFVVHHYSTYRRWLGQ